MTTVPATASTAATDGATKRGATESLDVRDFAPAHRARLTALRRSAPWRHAIDSGAVDRARAKRVPPGTTVDFVDTVVDPLVAANEARVAEAIAAGCRDREPLIDALGTWPAGVPDVPLPRLSFLGLTLTYGCNFDPRCVYCTQRFSEPAVDIDGWKRVIDAATRDNDGQGPYVYITGGEVLALEEGLWGDDGLIAYASRRGAAVNVNTNASLVTPAVALRLIQSGVSKLHVSLDTPHAAVQDAMWGDAGRCARVLRGLDHLQLARELVGADEPQIHINSVLTRRNLHTAGDLWAFLVARKKRVPKGHPLFYDLLPHIIPVGGDAEGGLRPTAAEVERFHRVEWDRVRAAWDHWQALAGVPQSERGPLFGPFRSPFERVVQHGDLASYAQHAADGHYTRLAMARACYVAPTQASVTPDGCQYRCGAHAVRRTDAIGSVVDGDLRQNIRAGLPDLAQLPRPASCDSCAAATVYINQSVEQRLAERVDALLAQAP
jgi:sulfatase maturation enzyme AslB (radical SAM superfamily)